MTNDDKIRNETLQYDINIDLSNLCIYYKKSYKNNNLNEEIELHDGSYIVYQIFKIILNISSENMKQLRVIL